MQNDVPPVADKGDGQGRPAEYVFRLYVTGATSRSSRAISNARRIFDRDLPGQYDLQIVDIYLEPLKAKEYQIVAAPTLVKVLPGPARRVIGDLSDEAKLRKAFGMPTPPEPEVTP
jgi:circadian clock protein KaiB